MTRFKMPGKPKGKARPRFARGHAYTPSETKAYESMIGYSYKKSGGKMIDGGVAIEIEAVYQVPASWTKAKKWEAINGDKQPTVKPDIDNIVKIIMDGLNGVAYKDDSQVVDVKATKAYSLDDAFVIVEVKGTDG